MDGPECQNRFEVMLDNYSAHLSSAFLLLYLCHCLLNLYQTGGSFW
jgi:hypothetical protein